ncbi:MAG: class I SAM-dependent methyltransferase, partial [Verrucomicrobiae bacterium]|nr:class I SAM-dependent methyltransferase [Verrucomicrobiae bacterium]NNJ86985.1 class I SAM-dependent rRNA methyltransferase [Akkermansiaceae bacterium]
MIRHKIQTAIEKRALILSKQTNALRLVDGEGDALPGLFWESYADRWVVSTRANKLDPEVRAWLEEQGKTSYWKRLDQHEKESPTHIAGPKQDEPFIARENGVNYKIHFQAGYSQGIFLDQRLNRKRVRDYSSPGVTVLNTFAYTGAFSVCAALGGATTTTLDLSQVYLDWAKDNFQANDLNPADHYFCKGDTFHWLK